jgi:hypothetical protein
MLHNYVGTMPMPQAPSVVCCYTQLFDIGRYRYDFYLASSQPTANATATATVTATTTAPSNRQQQQQQQQQQQNRIDQQQKQWPIRAQLPNNNDNKSSSLLTGSLVGS